MENLLEFNYKTMGFPACKITFDENEIFIVSAHIYNNKLEVRYQYQDELSANNFAPVRSQQFDLKGVN